MLLDQLKSLDKVLLSQGDLDKYAEFLAKHYENKWAIVDLPLPANIDYAAHYLTTAGWATVFFSEGVVEKITVFTKDYTNKELPTAVIYALKEL